MALQLGALRDALIAAGSTPDKANLAAEEVAAYENRLTQLTTLAQVMLAILVLLLGSQAGLWLKLADLSGQLATMNTQLVALTHANDAGH